MKRRTIIGLSLLVVGVVAATTSALIDTPGTIVWNQGGIAYQKRRALTNVDLTNQVPKETENIQKLTVISNDTNVYVQQGTQFSVTQNKNGNEKKARINYSNGELTVDTKSTSQSNRRIMDFSIGDDDDDGIKTGPSVTITIPKQTNIKNIDITQNNGHVSASDIALDNINIKTQNDDVDFARVIAKNIIIDAKNSEVDLNSVTSDQLTTKNYNDDLTVNGSTIKDINVSMQNADVDIEHSTITKGGRITNQGGDISFETSQLPTFSAQATNGNVEITPPFAQQQGTAALVIQNQNGDIEIE
ncbi:DUF4097 domain-containing protein [Leuconostoc carnosum]|uniref:DUF4097 family beta strand repeat-containing protein n=1 Tax=Leuconostoc carnosum TaxID=1252 RepID=UPI001238844D|nr:DUF4097 family beta strand repeat-containing protein [Leuconostoc carnosum]KAA8369766.1 DUF4097 domain-containing protein [Leuconostoc carnosum]KAA8380757.1 DUF4097 domain-containing protein [Leuconostoc carnosum]